MATLVWDQVGDRLYETGVSKGVLYQYNGLGVAWNGLTSIEESVDTQVEPVYFDGVKFNDLVTVGDFSAHLKAWTYPDEFMAFEGTLEDESGFYITNQRPDRFCLSYQTLIGDDVKGTESGYKIHVLYNLTAVPSSRNHETMALDVQPLEFEWDISSIPEDIEGYRPTSHVILDSRRIDPHLLSDIEDILYGDDINDPYLPPLQSFSTFIKKWERLIITDHDDGTWTADSIEDNVITMLDATTFQIDSDTAVVVDANSYTISSSDKNEEDLWLP
jgi:hypothetical protein